MKWSISLAALLLLPLFTACDRSAEAPQRVSVIGFVHEDGSQTPLSGVRVSVTDREVSEVKYTDSAGDFQYNGLRTGTYEFNFDKDGYIQVHKSIEVRLDRKNELDIPMKPIGH